MRGRLHEIDPAGIDGALFTMAAAPDAQPTGIALALFRDALEDAERSGDELVLRQGRVTIRVRRRDGDAG
jgi:hypothetical protein